MDWSDDPTSAQAVPWKLVGLIGGGVLVVLAIVFIVIRLLNASQDETALVQQIQTQSEPTLEACKNTQNPEGCKAAELSRLAQTNASSQVCDLLETQAQKENCYWELAKTTYDPASCAFLSEEESQTRCQDGVFLAQAKAAGNAQACASISTASAKTRCEQLFAPALTSEACLTSGEEISVCDDLKQFETAIAEQDVSYCDDILDESKRDTCKDYFGSVAFETSSQTELDTDQDGLSDADESTYGTDPNNPDTDGDGYLDGPEVESGYNPLGEGALE